ncbi:MAG: hypothetical protein QM496_13925 [Verrucomicrobiota bacterium]
MGIHIGVTNLDGHTAPATGAVQSRESESTVGSEDEMGPDSNSKYFVPHKYFRKEVSISGVGDAELALVVAASVAKGVLSILRAKQTEFQNSLPKFERSGFLLADIPPVV